MYIESQDTRLWTSALFKEFGKRNIFRSAFFHEDVVHWLFIRKCAYTHEFVHTYVWTIVQNHLCHESRYKWFWTSTLLEDFRKGIIENIFDEAKEKRCSYQELNPECQAWTSRQPAHYVRPLDNNQLSETAGFSLSSILSRNIKPVFISICG